MNKKALFYIGLTLIPAGFLGELLAYIFGTLCAYESSGLAMLYFFWSALGFAGGIASWVAGVLCIATSLKEDK